MTQDNSSRITIACPQALIASVNAAAPDLALKNANWQDADGKAYAIVSFIAHGAIDLGDLKALGAVFLGESVSLSSPPEGIVVIRGGAANPENLQLSPVLPQF